MEIKLDFDSITRYGLTLRLVDENDALFIHKLRTDPALGQHLSTTSSDPEDQVRWIRRYKERESDGLEYYFISAAQNGERWGTTRLSEISSSSFELGSWLFDRNAPSGTAIKADIITKEIGFEMLGVKNCTFNVRKENKSVLKYHLLFNPIVVDEDELNIFFMLKLEDFVKSKNRFIKAL